MMRARIASVLASPPPASGGRTLIAEAIERYGRFQIQTSWSENTFKHTHEPSLRLFRELVGVSTQAAGSNDTELHAIDRPLEELTRADIERFIEEFWKYPAQQGQRSGQTAREVLQAGGAPQSRANVFKRLAHIRQFLAYCRDKNYVQSEVVQEIDLVLAKDTARAREKAALAAAGSDGVIADGYVAFSRSDLGTLFGEDFARHAKNNPARFWIPLLGLYAGLRVGEASQLRPSDFQTVDGIQCLRVAGESVGQAVDNTAQRVKTVASLRVVPVHPRLVELGLMKFVVTRMAAKQKWMWDGLLWTAKSGFGKYPSRDFQKLAEKTGVYQPRRKVFHSLRSTIAQELELQGLEGDLIDRFLGHEVKNTRVKNYSRTEIGRAFPVVSVFNVLRRIEFPVLAGSQP
jgi:integrase